VSPAPRCWGAVLQNATLVAGGLVVSVLLLELGLRLFAPLSPSWSQPDDTLGWAFIPHAAYRFVAPEGCPGWTSSGQINSHGLRDREYPYAKPPGTYRILALGDSYTEGLQHDLDHIWPKLLEQRLNQRGGDMRYEVINGGRSGMGTGLEYLFYTSRGRRYAADLVVLLVIGNDVEDNSAAFREPGGYGPYFSLDGDALVVDDSFKRERAYWVRSVLTPLKQRSALVSYVLRQYYVFVNWRAQTSGAAVSVGARAAGAAEVETPVVAPYSPAIVQAVAVTQRLLVELNEAVRADGARLVVFNGSRETWDPAQPDALVRAVANEQHLAYLDLIPPMEAAAARSGTLMFGCRENGGGGHWSRAGQATAAALIYEFLESSGVLPAER